MIFSGMLKRISGRAFPAESFIRSISRPTRMLPNITKNTDTTGIQAKNRPAHLLMFSTFDRYALK